MLKVLSPIISLVNDSIFLSRHDILKSGKAVFLYLSLFDRYVNALFHLTHTHTPSTPPVRADREEKHRSDSVFPTKIFATKIVSSTAQPVVQDLDKESIYNFYVGVALMMSLAAQPALITIL